MYKELLISTIRAANLHASAMAPINQITFRVYSQMADLLQTLIQLSPLSEWG